MVRRYGDPVEVRPVPGEVAQRVSDAPATFLWRGRLYVVKDVLGHWHERRSWWTAGAARAVHGDLPDDAPADGESDFAGDSAKGEEQQSQAAQAATYVALGTELEVWRVEASRGQSYASGVYDLSRELSPDPGHPGEAWRLLRVTD